jgi:protein TonB
MRKEILALITIFLFATNLSAQCTGSEFCSTCTNCSKCKHCKGTGYCGACEPNRFKTKEKNTAIKKAEEEKNKSSESQIDGPIDSKKQNAEQTEDISKPKENSIATPEIYTIVEEQAEFPGGIAELGKYINENLKYPSSAKENGISGKCFTIFIVNEDGKISGAKILKGVSDCPECDIEAARLITSMPNWKLARVKGRNVNCYFNLPISFKIQ